MLWMAWMTTTLEYTPFLILLMKDHSELMHESLRALVLSTVVGPHSLYLAIPPYLDLSPQRHQAGSTTIALGSCHRCVAHYGYGFLLPRPHAPTRKLSICGRRTHGAETN